MTRTVSATTEEHKDGTRAARGRAADSRLGQGHGKARGSRVGYTGVQPPGPWGGGWPHLTHTNVPRAAGDAES
eukprot:765737-Hanusia_phi.AAC.5